MEEETYLALLQVAEPVEQLVVEKVVHEVQKMVLQQPLIQVPVVAAASLVPMLCTP